jgi:hypothetical protein
MKKAEQAAEERPAAEGVAPARPSKPVIAKRRGRPRKAERAYSERQIRRDLLSLMETPVPIKVNGKVRRFPAIMGVYWKMMLLALEGDTSMIRDMVKLRSDLVRRHSEQNPDDASFLEEGERKLAALPDELLSEEEWALLNHVRARSRKV